MLVSDYDLTASEIQHVANANAVVGLFTLLGYATENRILQTPAALGFAEGLAREVIHIERIADNDEGELQVYLIEMKRVTVALTQALARAFKNRSGQFLLVLTTSDYLQLDFVLLELQNDHPPMLRPRILPVDRRDPDRVSLRVLRRFSYTEADANYQWDKLLSAYSIAEWSEPLFNNRALFSDYYLNERLPLRSEWKEDPRQAYRAISDLFVEAREKFARQPEGTLRRSLFEPVFSILGWQATANKAAQDDFTRADYDLLAPSGLTVPCLTYVWDRSLDGPDGKNIDPETPYENPAQTVVSVLDAMDARAAGWAIITNGKVWRLYSARAHSRSTHYYEIDLEETLVSPDVNEAFRYFWLFFRGAGFASQPLFVDTLLSESALYAKALGERLKENVFENVFPLLAEGFIANWGKPAETLSDAELRETFQATLTFLYRVLFLLYAEARDLLPVKEVRGYRDISLKQIKEEIAKQGGMIADLAPSKLKEAYSARSTDLYDRLTLLFRVIDRGDPVRNVPVYNGGLFITLDHGKLTGWDETEAEELRMARFLTTHHIPDRFLAQGLDLLARDVDDKTQSLAMIDYKSLGVRQLGSIYEGLLEFRLRVATEKMAVVVGKKGDQVVRYAEAKEKGLKPRMSGKGAARTEFVYSKGEVYLENDQHERKATGSYYTPDYIVKYIVQNSVGPALEEKLEGLRPKLREAQKAYQAAVARQKAFQKMEQKGDDPEKTAFTYRPLVDELFDLRVLDPAMGSGHFLVEAVDFITDRILAFLNAFPWNPVTAALRETRQTILSEMQRQGVSIDPARLTDVNLLKRRVLKRCIYGVDLNPMTVELAKVSLWLDCFTLGAPLSFLDHHLKCGNSLIGAQVNLVREEIEMVTTTRSKKVAESAQTYRTRQVVAQQFQMFGSMWAGAMLATDLMRQVGELPDTTVRQVLQSRVEYQRAVDALAPFKRILDVYTSRWFGNPDSKLNQPVLQFLRDEQNIPWLNNPQRNHPASVSGYREIAETALKALREKRFFHWELEFPEVFFGPSIASDQEIVVKEFPGFDAIIGNPPYIRVQELQSLDKQSANYYTVNYLTAVSSYDIYSLFVERCITLTKLHGRTGFILPNKFFTASYGEPLRKLLSDRKLVRQIVNFTFGQVFSDVTTYTCLIFIEPGNQLGFKYLELSDPQSLETSQNLAKIDVSSSKLTAAPWTFFSTDIEKILEKVKQCSEPFSRIANRLFQGLRTSDNEVFVLNNVSWDDNGGFVSGENGLNEKVQIERSICRPFLSGEDISRYEPLAPSKAVIVPYHPNKDTWALISEENLKQKFPLVYAYLASHKSRLEQREKGKMVGSDWYGYVYPKNLEILSAKKILTKDIIESVAFSIDTTGETAFATGYGITLETRKNLSIYYVLALLNSRTLDFCLKRLNSLLRGGYVRVFTQYLEPLPIRRIEFTTPSAKRRHLFLEAEKFVISRDDTKLLEFVSSRFNGHLKESDVVHDLLAYLAQRMLELNKQKQREMTRWISWLEGILQVHMEDLTGKSKLNNYLGDYQKGEAELSYLELEDILYKNKSKLGISLSDGRTQEHLRTEYENTLNVLRPIKASLVWTDRLIDQIVYKLYDLSEAEIATVEGKLGLEPELSAVETVPSIAGRPQTISRVSYPHELACILHALDQHGPLTTRQLADVLSDQRITLQPRKAITLSREFAFLGWIKADSAQWELTGRGKVLAAIGCDEFVGEFARQLCLDNELHNKQIISRLLLRTEQLSPDLQGAIILPRPEMEELPDSLEDLRKLLHINLPRWSYLLQKQVRNFAGFSDSNALVDQLIAKVEAGWPSDKDSERTRNLRDRVREAFLDVMFGHIISASDVEIWQERMDWAGLTHTARDLPGMQGQVWFPVGTFRKTGDDFTPVVGLVNHPGYPDALTFHRFTPNGAAFEKQFMQVMYEGYRQVQQAQRGNEYVSLLAVRDWVCYRFRISHEVFEDTLQSLFPRALRGEIPYSLALEVDITPAELNRLGNARPVKIDKQPRYIVAMRSRAS